MQLGGAALAAWFLQAVVHVSATYGSNYPAGGLLGAATRSGWRSILTFGLVSVILGTASGAQNIGVFGALGVGAYIALAGLWGSPISGASMNPARTFGPDLVGATSPTTGSTLPARCSGCSSPSAWRSCFAAAAAAVQVWKLHKVR